MSVSCSAFRVSRLKGLKFDEFGVLRFVFCVSHSFFSLDSYLLLLGSTLDVRYSMLNTRCYSKKLKLTFP